MPYRINGIGTWYYGKRNIHQYHGKCRHCLREGLLSSYDTTLYFTFFFIPLVPLGKKRILEYCPHCRMHLRLNADKWERMKKEAYTKAWDDFQRDPWNPKTVQDLLGTFTSFQDPIALKQISPQIFDHFKDNAEVMENLGLAHFGFGNLKESEEGFRKSLKIKDEPETRELLAEILIRQSKPEEAEPYLQHILQNPDKVWLLRLQGMAWQAEGNHQKALEVMDQAQALVPALAGDKKFKKTRKISEKNVATGKKITQKELLAGIAKPAEGKDTGGRIAKIMAPSIILIILGMCLFGSYSIGRSRKAYFVNGLSLPYKISVKGKEYTLQPNHYQAINVGEGGFLCEIKDSGLDIKPQTITIKTPFLTRIFLRRTFIVNPDMAAVLLWEKDYYSAKPENAPSNEYAFYSGMNTYTFGNIDYIFQPFPESINIPGDKSVSKTRLSLPVVQGEHPVKILKNLEKFSGKTVTIQVAKRHVLYEPENVEGYLAYLFSVMEGKSFLEMVSEKLDHRPILLEWHRMYQNAKETYDPDWDLEPEYRHLLETDPENPSLQYLLGRVVPDQNEAVRLFQKSVSGPQPVKQGYFALTMHYLNTARFEEALENSKNTTEYQQGRDIVDRALYYESLFGAGRYDELFEAYQRELKKDAFNMYALSFQMEALLSSGNIKKADETLGSWFMKNDKYLVPKYRNDIRIMFDIQKTYITGDLEAWGKIIEKNPSPAEQFQLAITRGNMEEAKTFLEKCEDKDMKDYLLLYIAMKKANQGEEARKYLIKACEILREGYWEKRLIADCLEGIQKPDPAQICSQSFVPGEKIYILIAMGMTYPEQKDTYFALARKLNYHKDFPHLFFKSILEEP